jgi:hypothetical protein
MWLNARNDSSWVGFHNPTTTELLARDLLMSDITREAASKKAVREMNKASLQSDQPANEHRSEVK